MYMINLSKADLSWLQKAANKKDVRSFTTQIYVKEGYAYTTNGHVVHRVKVALDEIEGLYNYQGVKLEDKDYKGHPISRKDIFAGFNTKLKSFTLTPEQLNVLRITDTISINKTYFDNVCGKESSVNILLHDNNQSILIEHTNKAAVVMVIRTP